MDIFAHSLWGIIIFKLILFKDLNPLFVILFSILPDLAAFVPLTFQMLYDNSVRFTRKNTSKDKERLKKNIPDYVFEIYNYTHSFVVTGAIFLVLFFTLREYSFYILPWMLHILADIPSHERDFFGTPILYPVSNFRFDGIPWSNKWHMIINYSLILIVGSVVLLC